MFLFFRFTIQLDCYIIKSKGHLISTICPSAITIYVYWPSLMHDSFIRISKEQIVRQEQGTTKLHKRILISLNEI